MADSIDAAIESAESLIASLLTRERSTHQSENEELLNGHLEGNEAEVLGSATQDPEQSLFSPRVDQSLVAAGVASFWPTSCTASSQAVYPVLDGYPSPRESLHALVSKVSERSLLDSPSLNSDGLRRILQERDKDLEIAAKIGQALLQRNEVLESDLSKVMEQKAMLEQQLRQIQHTMARKEEVLRLYASEQEEQTVNESNSHYPEWVKVLTDECRELKDSNLQLQEEADKLRKETADIESKEKELVQQCLEQFAEAKKRLSELREEAESKQEETQKLQSELARAKEELRATRDQWNHHVEEADMIREQLSEVREQNSHLAHAGTELQDKLEEANIMLKEAKDEIAALKETNLQFSSSPGEPTHVEHESIVQEIEEVLRKEIIAASTLPERPRSPNHYAQQRTMVVMETVRAATLASARKKERLTKPAQPLPLAASSPREKQSKPDKDLSAVGTSPLSPISSGHLGSLEEVVRYRNQNYVAPEKLQIVKPLEGSVTLLKWKLLASPQLGGATTFFSDATRPGVHMKRWKAGGVIDEGEAGLASTRIKSLSTTDISSLESHLAGYPKREAGGEERCKSGLSSRANQAPSQSARDDLLVVPKKPQKQNKKSLSKSLLGQVGSFLGSSWSQLSFASKEAPSVVEEEEAKPTAEGAGLAELLES